MQELIEQVLDYLKGIWIKRRYIMISTWLICPIAWLYVAQLDDVYESKARVYADTQSILGPLLKGLTVETNPEIQIRLMVKTLLSRPNLERITRMTDLDVQANTPAEYEGLIDNLARDIKIQKVGSRRARGENIYTISFVDQNPEMARNVVQSVLTVFIENTLGENRSDSDSAQKFLDSQIKEYENRLLAGEARLTDFKQKYSDALPSDSGGFYAQLNIEKQRLASAQLELKEIETSIISAKKQLSASNQNPQATSDKITDANSVSTSYDERIMHIENNLDGLLLRYTDHHPDVIETKRLLESLNESRRNELQNYYQNIAENNDGNSSNLNSLNINPVYQEIKIQVNQLENEAASLRVRVNNFQSKVNNLESRIHTIPEIEAELVALNRGYGITKDKYEQLLNRKETAQIAQQADETTSKIQFKVIEPPRVPTEPTGPKRLLFLALVTVIGIGVGVGLSLLMSQMNPVVTSSSQVAKATGIPIFGVVAATPNLGLQQWHKRKTNFFILSNSLLFLLLACFVAYTLFPDAIKSSIKGIL